MFVNESTLLKDIEIINITESSDPKTNTEYVTYTCLILTSNTANYEVEFVF